MLVQAVSGRHLRNIALYKALKAQQADLEHLPGHRRGFITAAARRQAIGQIRSQRHRNTSANTWWRHFRHYLKDDASPLHISQVTARDGTNRWQGLRHGQAAATPVHHTHQKLYLQSGGNLA